MNDSPNLPFLFAILGFGLLYLAWRAVRRRKIISSTGKENSTSDLEYYIMVLGAVSGGLILLLLAGIGFYEQRGIWIFLSYLAIVSGLSWWIYRFRKLKAQAGLHLKKAFIPGQRSRLDSTISQKWALAAVALVSQVSGRDHKTLGGRPLTPSNLRKARKKLRREWDIRDQEDFDEIQDWLLETGHRAEFLELIERIMGRPDTEVQAYLDEVNKGGYDFRSKTERKEETCRVELIQQEGKELKRRGFLAWDYIRYIDNCRLGYLAGYLEEEAAWDNIQSVAQVLQSRYDSWRELGETFIHARVFWSCVEDRRNGIRYERTFRKLLKNAKSPWVKIPWETPLYSRK